jgi:hypothetical protein
MAAGELSFDEFTAARWGRDRAGCYRSGVAARR